MRKVRFLLALVAFVAAACSPDSLTRTGPENGKITLPEGLQPTHIGDADLAALIQADLTCLYNDVGLLPNESSSLGKFKNIMNLLAADDLQGAIDATANLVSFIELKYSQWKGSGTVDCPGIPEFGILLVDLKDRTITRLNAYVNLQGAVCEIPEGQEAFCETPDGVSAFVYFPPDILSQLTYVSLVENPPGFTNLQNLFDEYPTYVRIVTEPFADFSGFPVKPLVVVCHNYDVLPNDASLLARLLLGARHASGFELLQPADFSQYSTEVAAFAAGFCPVPSAAPSFGFSPSTTMGRLANRVLDFLMPDAIQAQYATAFGGVGGSPEEFSEFGAVDAGVNAAFGGAGGSPEEFAPPAATPGAAPAASPTADPDDVITGKVGTRLTDYTLITVATGTGTPVPGASVTFVLSNPIPALEGGQYDDPSLASFCGITTVVTNASGQAALPCLDFGTEIGYKNLAVTVDASAVDPSGLACVFTSDEPGCDQSTTRYFLISTVAGDPAQLAVINAPASTSAVAGAAMDPQPIVEIQDAGGNPVGTLIQAITVSAAVSAGGSLSGGTSADADLGTGQATFSTLALGGVVGTSYTITFSADGLTDATATVAVTGPGTPANLAVSPTSTTAAAGGLIPAITATVTDAFTNGVPGIGVSVAATDLVCFAGADCTSVNTGAVGTALFNDLSIRGSGTSRTLTFSSVPLTDQTVALTLTPGTASVILLDVPAGGNYGSGLAPFSAASPSPRVLVQDAWQNDKPGATVLWQVAGAVNGASVSSSSTNTDAAGKASVGWTFGDGGNGLSAFLGSLGGPSVSFTAGTATGGIALECAATTNLKKATVGTYDQATNTWKGNLTMKPELVGRYRRLTLQMSVTGQASGTGDYPSEVRIYRWENGARGLHLGTGVPDDPQNLIRLPGDNGTPNPVHYVVTPTSAQIVPGNNYDVLIEVDITTPLTRTPNLWYNSKPAGGFCSNALLWLPGVTPFSGSSPKHRNDGLLIRVTN